MPSTVADLLRLHRSAVGLSQQELARRSGLSERALRDLERGASTPRVHSLRAIAAALGLTGSDQAAFLAAREQREQREQAAVPADALPAATDLVGRERELTMLVDLVTGTRHRLITVLGPAGIGKSTLAAALVETLRTRTGPEALAVDLSALTDPDLVGEVVLEAVEGGSRRGDPVDRIAATLRGRRLVLVLDRLERLTAAAPVLAAVVRRCPGLTVLVTSQRPLRVTGERLVRLDPLPLPDAVRLFALRAAEMTGTFELSTANAPVVAAICAKVEGLPLAIELAAARIRVLTPADLDARLARRLAILTDGAADRPTRHRSLRAAIESSLDLITGPGRTLFAWLGGFTAGCHLDDLEAVVRNDVIGPLTELVDTGLVRVTVDKDHARYTLPDMVAELAAEHLAARSDRAAVEAAVATRFLDRLRTDRHDERDVDNLRAAVTWTVEHDPGNLDATVVDRLGRYFEHTGRFVEGDAVLRRIAAAGQPIAWVAAGRIALLGGDLSGPSTMALRALDGLAAHDDRGRATALLLLGTVAAERRDAAEARRHLRAALRHARRADDDDLTGRVLNNLGNLSNAMGLVRAAERQYGAALVVKRRGGSTAAIIGYTLSNLADLALKDGRFDTAAERAAEAADDLDATDYPRAAALARSTLALALVGCGRPAAAMAAIDAAGAPLDDDRRIGVVVALRRSVVLHASGDPAAAADLLARTVPRALDGDHTVREETAYMLITHAELLAGRRPDTARGLVAAAVALIGRTNRPVPPHQARAIARIGHQDGAALATLLTELAHS